MKEKKGKFDKKRGEFTLPFGLVVYLDEDF
jgi:hypothetical protein